MLMNLFRRDQAETDSFTIEDEDNFVPSSEDERMAGYEEQLTHLVEQKELHTLALKEMYQFILKLDASLREENQKLRTLIKTEQERSEKLIEVTKGLWDILQSLDEGQREPTRIIHMTREVAELERFNVDIQDESENSLMDIPGLDGIKPRMSAIA